MVKCCCWRKQINLNNYVKIRQCRGEELGNKEIRVQIVQRILCEIIFLRSPTLLNHQHETYWNLSCCFLLGFFLFGQRISKQPLIAIWAWFIFTTESLPRRVLNLLSTPLIRFYLYIDREVPHNICPVNKTTNFNLKNITN